eukprot:8056584-Prorocentrum_lima.AAC.1
MSAGGAAQGSAAASSPRENCTGVMATLAVRQSWGGYILATNVAQVPSSCLPVSLQGRRNCKAQ